MLSRDCRRSVLVGEASLQIVPGFFQCLSTLSQGQLETEEQKAETESWYYIKHFSVSFQFSVSVFCFSFPFPPFPVAPVAAQT